ncbi:type III toxin-antitoxin system ToxN/AbiQ family toxin [Salmonella enterica subsp. enterica serovar Enteritidis]|uniref:Endoribonuclease ToxN n=1 Tax=Salmonella enterica TaxID=28901 RepID=A0A727B8V6_SALER|nr:type III toxin-antitoxin system ToxN/AbiQ family toxin [Salmonella enterica]EDD5708002.1 type III toxin-antitoxin system ToxN/AbiQ family toxin [Salmonella enterica subsp. enterica serovar Enteritidis]ELN95151.1 ToxN [Salmonella enterica subsp. enterica serovar Enteritidis str. 22558]MDW3488333.1 type III toxin-antitoxin system ToxN/AbiQ family toxin [Escherichia coli]HAE1777299.1 type III toxin-antitoxin system ToxN/AbiQ family toxin [Salmonella enterica subsp. enterica]HAE7015782.1 type I
MKFYTISSSYIKYLKDFDDKVPNSEDPTYNNPKAFIGIVLEIEGHKYLAPLTSPKAWHANVKESSPAFFKLHENGVPDNQLGLINLKFMIPIIEAEVSLLDLDSMPDTPYKRMLYKQLQFIRVNEDKISEKSKLLRNLALQGRMQGTCDFAMLEEKYQHFGKKPEDMEIDD